MDWSGTLLMVATKTTVDGIFQFKKLQTDRRRASTNVLEDECEIWIYPNCFLNLPQPLYLELVIILRLTFPGEQVPQ